MTTSGAERYSAVLPILNKGCAIPTTVPLPLSDGLTFRKIRGDDLATITEHDDDSNNFLKGGTYTLTFDPFDEIMDDDSLNRMIVAALFSINVLGQGVPLSLHKCYVIRSLRKTSIYKTYSISGSNYNKLDKFEISKGTDLGYAASLFSAVCTALQKHPALRITISRFNSAMGRAAFDDKLIDLCIALESVFQSQTEISFQFALYNSILAEDDLGKRQNIFLLLKKLYTQRSNVVHGNKDLDTTWVSDHWNDLVLIAKSSILRKIDFLRENDHSDWKSYLERLALGMEND